MEAKKAEDLEGSAVSSKSVEFFEVFFSNCSRLCQFGLSYFPLFQFLLLFILSQVVLGSFSLYVPVYCCKGFICSSGCISFSRSYARLL